MFLLFNSLERLFIFKKNENLLAKTYIQDIFFSHFDKSFILKVYSKNSGKKYFFFSFHDKNKIFYEVEKKNQSLYRSKLHSSFFLNFLKKELHRAFIFSIKSFDNGLAWLLEIHKKEKKYLFFQWHTGQENLFILDQDKNLLHQFIQEKHNALLSIENLKEDQASDSISLKERDLLFDHLEKNFLKRFFEMQKNQILFNLKKKIKKNEGFLKNLKKDFQAKSKWKEWIEYGKSIQYSNCNLNEYKKDWLLNSYFASEENQKHWNKKILLIPNKTLKENMEIFFKKAKKYKSAISHLELMIENSKQLENDLKEKKTQIENIKIKENPFDFITQILELKNSFKDFNSPSPPVKKKGALKESQKKFLSFKNKEEKIFLVGRNKKENHQITFKIAKGIDIFLHTKDYSGAHVLIRMNKNEVLKEKTLLQGASLALHYSKARKHKEAWIIYSQKKYIESIKKQEGRVLFKKSKSFFLKENHQILKELKKVI